jgi:hypothetical protein
MRSLQVKQMPMNIHIGIKLYQKLVQLSIRNAATNAPINIKNIVPGPRIVLPSKIIDNLKINVARR